MRTFFLTLIALFLAGCGTLAPKQVELFQDKVRAFPEPSPALREVQRQAMYRAMNSATAAVEAAIAEQASTNVVVPAQETAQLTRAVAVSLGPPQKPSTLPAENLAVKLESKVADYSVKVDDFKWKNNENTGKKIEGTGLIQVSYFAWAGGILLGLLLLFVVLRVLLVGASAASPLASLGLLGVQATERTVVKGLAQIIRGGEAFKTWVSREIADAGLQKKILEAFRNEQLRAQDQDVQNTVMAMTK